MAISKFWSYNLHFPVHFIYVNVFTSTQRGKNAHWQITQAFVPWCRSSRTLGFSSWLAPGWTWQSQTAEISGTTNTWAVCEGYLGTAGSKSSWQHTWGLDSLSWEPWFNSVWSLEAPGWLGTSLHCKSRDTETVLHSLGQEPEGLGRLSGSDVMLWTPDSRPKPEAGHRRCVFPEEVWRTLQSTLWYQSRGDSGSSGLANPVEAMELNWWPMVLHDLLVVGNLFLDRLYNGTEIFLAVVWRAVSIVPCLWVCISPPAQGDFLPYFFSSKITWQLDVFIKLPAAWFTI